MNITDLHNDTICAISTPAGVGGIAVIRVSGPDAIAIADSIWRGKPLAGAKSHTVHYGSIADAGGNVVDDCVATLFRAPGSFTGEDVVELSVHGSVYVQQAVIQLLTAAGARIAERGEFTRRAFASGKMDLAQAEAVADLIASRSRAAHDIAIRQMKGGFSRRLSQLHDSLLNLASLLELELDFSEEDVEFASRQALLDQAQQLRDEIQRLATSFAGGNAIKEGIPVVIVGATNVGKSSLLNLLVGDDRAIVSDIHGTTRDLIEDTVNIGDYTFRFIDTAGLRDTSDTIERLGIDRSRSAMSRAAIILHVIDATTLPATAAQPNLPENPGLSDKSDLSDPSDLSDSSDSSDLTDLNDFTPADNQALITILNKTDLLPAPLSTLNHRPSALNPQPSIPLSAKTGEGIDRLRQKLQDIAARLTAGNGDIIITNARHHEALRNALTPLQRVIDGLTANLSGDLIAQDLREVLHHLGTITGAITTPDILSTIFTRFCIGK